MTLIASKNPPELSERDAEEKKKDIDRYRKVTHGA